MCLITLGIIMSDRETEPQEESWSRDLVETYRQQIVDYYCQLYLRELESIDEFVLFLGEDLPNANAIWKRMVYNVKRRENYERNKRNGDPKEAS